MFQSKLQCPAALPMATSSSTSKCTVNNKYAVVTGGNKGIGLEICRQLASQGVSVVLTARNKKRGLEAVDKLKRSGLSVMFHQLDVLDSASVAALAAFVKSQIGKLDILVNNAGVGENTVKGGYQSVVDIMQTNYYGAKRATETLLPLLKLSDSPRIVNMSSTMGRLGGIRNKVARDVLGDAEKLTEKRIDQVLDEFLKDVKEGSPAAKGWPTYWGAYCVSKAALTAYTRILAKKYPRMRINAVCPGWVQTDLSNHSGSLSPAEGAKSPVRLALLPDNGPSGLFFDQQMRPVQPPTNTKLIETLEDAEKCFQTNYYGAKRITGALIPLLELSDSPRIVNVSSSFGTLKILSNEWAKGVFSIGETITEEKIEEVVKKFINDFRGGLLESNGWPKYATAYKVSKAALNAYTRIMAKEYPHLCINCVCPGFVATDMTANLGPLTAAEGAASPVKLALLPDGGPSGLFFYRDEVFPF